METMRPPIVETAEIRYWLVTRNFLFEAIIIPCDPYPITVQDNLSKSIRFVYHGSSLCQMRQCFIQKWSKKPINTWHYHSDSTLMPWWFSEHSGKSSSAKTPSPSSKSKRRLCRAASRDFNSLPKVCHPWKCPLKSMRVGRLYRILFWYKFSRLFLKGLYQTSRVFSPKFPHFFLQICRKLESAQRMCRILQFLLQSFPFLCGQSSGCLAHPFLPRECQTRCCVNVAR